VDIPEIPADRRDPQVKEDVMQSGPAILNWALNGLDRLRERGRFEIPQSVIGATDEFREYNDVPALFVKEQCYQGDKGIDNDGERLWESSSALYAAYKEWCLNTGHKPQSSTSTARHPRAARSPDRRRGMDSARPLSDSFCRHSPRARGGH
jgi:phage/plasmid-associated DNA primase